MRDVIEILEGYCVTRNDSQGRYPMIWTYSPVEADSKRIYLDGYEDPETRWEDMQKRYEVKVEKVKITIEKLPE